MKNEMYYGAGNLIFERAKALRNNMTDAEQILWGHLKNNQLGVKFRRQHPIAIYIVDFYCHPYKLVIEVDGDIHEEEDIKQADKERETHLKELSLKIVRFTNKEIYHQIGKVLEIIKSNVQYL